MQQLAKNIFHFLTGRLARNIYLWAYILYTRFQYLEFHISDVELRYHFLLLAMLLTLLYVNNLLLVPRLLAGKKIIFYFISILPLLYLYAFSATMVVYSAVAHGCNVYHVIWTPLGSDILSEKDLLIVTTMLFAGAFTLVFTLCWYAMEYAKRLKELKQSKKMQEDTELHFLKNQLNPHFLFNTLNNIYGLALDNPNSAPELILKLSVILRYLLYESNEHLVSFRKEMALMEAFNELELLRLRQHNHFHFEVGCDKEDYLIPPLLWLPVLENIFKYGIDTKPTVFRCIIVEDIMHIYSENGYIADEVTRRKGKGHGLGLSNLRKRLQILYHKRFTFTITDENELFVIDIEINLQ